MGGHHTDLIKEISQEYSDMLESSDQAIYIFIDDEAKVCNNNFSNLLGYESADEWAQAEGGFTELFVADKSQQELVSHYQKAMEHYVGSEFSVTWKTKSGEMVDTKVILVPILFKNHSFALHFVTKA